MHLRRFVKNVLMIIINKLIAILIFRKMPPHKNTLKMASARTGTT